MRHWLFVRFSSLFVAAAAASVSPSMAAQINHLRISNLDVIQITGEIEIGDAEKFRRLSLAYENAIVALDSNGGMIMPAMEIGRVIKINEHPTLVTSGSTCASACALIWVAGSKRFLSGRGRIGFHASYKDDAGRKIETGMGNALIGHYLGSLNLPTKAVVFATRASPNDILWLDATNMNKSGIQFDEFPDTDLDRPVQIRPTVSSVKSIATSPFSQPTYNANAVLRTGTEVPLRLSEELTTKGKQLRVGQRFRMETTVPVVVQGVTVIPTGSPAVGEITEVRNKGGWGKSGHFGARILSVTANGRQIRLSGAFDDKGKAGGVGAVAVSTLIFLPAGFFMTGTSAQLPVGTPVKGFVDEDVQLALAAAAPAPMVVAVPAPVVAAPSKGM